MFAIRASTASARQACRLYSASGAPQTLYDKIWESHLVDEDLEAKSALIYVDRHLVHEVTSPQAFEGLRLAGRSVRRTECTLATPDHNVPTTERKAGYSSDSIVDDDSRTQVQALESNVVEFGVTLFGMSDSRQGIVHIVGPEQGFTQPGQVIVCGDSHTATHGAFGALAFGIGTSEVEHVLATQCLVQAPAKNMKVQVDGELLPGVTSKDLVLHVIGHIGTAGGTGHVIEFCGSAVRSLSMEARLTMCNMAIEGGARAGLVAPDEITMGYLKGRPMAPQGELWEKACEYWRTLPSDPGAMYDTEVVLDAANIPPTITWGTSPEDTCSIEGFVPDPAAEADSNRAAAIQRALEYMGLQAGTKIDEIPIDKVFIGSCTNGRIEDMRALAEVAKGRKVAPNVKQALVVPGSGLVKLMAEDEGLDTILTEAGFEWREPGCSMCLAMNADRLEPGERCASTSNRNFEGRQGRGGRTHLMNPAMAAAAAITGKLADVRQFHKAGFATSAAAPFVGGPIMLDARHMSTAAAENPMQFTTVSGTAAPLDVMNVDTDMIIPKGFLKTIKRTGLGVHAFDEMRYELLEDGSRKEKPDFVLNQEPYRGAPILVAGDNFGCGSSREHAPWALRDFGIRSVISTSFADIFFNNCFKNGMLPVTLTQEQCDVCMADAKAELPLEVDLENEAVVRSNGEKIPFTTEPFRRYCLLNGLDDIGLTLQKSDKIEAYEAKRKELYPWL